MNLHTLTSAFRKFCAGALTEDDGMSTIEYAMGSLAAAALAATLFTIVSGDGVLNAMQEILTSALSKTPR